MATIITKSQTVLNGLHIPENAIPPLENGDRLTRDEFERRYHAMPDHIKAELIEGVVYIASPVRNIHGQAHHQIGTWLGIYAFSTPGVASADNTTVRLDLNNEPQPDLFLRIDPALGGRALITDDGYIQGAPELIIEVAASSASYDLGVKKDVYLRHGVLEYIVWRVRDRQIDWWHLANGEYVDLVPDPDGIARSQIFPGLWLDISALLETRLITVMTALQTGIATNEHRDFVARLGRS